jgi:hypothetical protein
MDTGYFTKAFAASPGSVLPGYVTGGVFYFSIPWAIGTVMGMSALGLESSKAFPTYPRVSLSDEIIRCSS